MAEKKSLASKLAHITGEMRAVPKEGYNAAQKYKFVRETDVAEKLSKLIAEQNIFLHQSVLERSTRELYHTASGMTMWLTDVLVQFTWIDGDSGETLPPSTFPGHGADTGDKGIYKALTGAEKYFIMKTFLVSTGDDPEGDDSVDRATAAASASSGSRVNVAKTPPKDAGRGAKPSNATTAQVGEIARLSKALKLDVESLIPVIEKIIGFGPEDGKTMREWLSSMTHEQAGSIVAGLTAMLQAGDSAGASHDADNASASDEPGGFAIS